MTSIAAAGGAQLVQRYELAAALCGGLRVLDLGDAPAAARAPLSDAAAELMVGDAEGSFDVVVALDGRSDRLDEVERRAAGGMRALVAVERPRGRPKNPRINPPFEETARALGERLGDATVLPQFLAEGAVIGTPDNGTAQLVDLRLASPEVEAAALIVVSGFDAEAVHGARARLRLTAEPIRLSYLRELELANAELLRANRRLMAGRLGRDGSAAASLVAAQRQAEDARAEARFHMETARRVEAWYDAPRYHLADRIRDLLTKIPGLTTSVRFVWSLVSTRAETPYIDAAANPRPEEEPELTGGGLVQAELSAESTDVSSRLEE